MTSRRKLEEEIARTQDPLVRKQLQELLDKRKQRRDKTIKGAKEIGSSLLDEIAKGEPPSPQEEAFFGIVVIVFVGIVAILGIHVFLLLLFE